MGGSARLEFKNAYGSVDEDISYDANFISDLLPNEITDKLVQNSPVILAKYTNYKAAVENVKTIRAKDDFNVGFEARALKPFAGSSKDSDESLKRKLEEFKASQLPELDSVKYSVMESIKNFLSRKTMKVFY